MWFIIVVIILIVFFTRWETQRERHRHRRRHGYAYVHFHIEILIHIDTVEFCTSMPEHVRDIPCPFWSTRAAYANHTRMSPIPMTMTRKWLQDSWGQVGRSTDRRDREIWSLSSLIFSSRAKSRCSVFFVIDLLSVVRSRVQICSDERAGHHHGVDVKNSKNQCVNEGNHWNDRCPWISFDMWIRTHCRRQEEEDEDHDFQQNQRCPNLLWLSRRVRRLLLPVEDFLDDKGKVSWTVVEVLRTYRTRD